MQNSIQKKKQGFTLLELLTVIAVIGILTAILITGINSMRERARLTQSNSNLRQLWSMVLMYGNEHGGELPGNGFNTNAWQHQVVRWHEGWDNDKTTEFFLEVDAAEGEGRFGILDIFRSPLSDEPKNTLSWGSPGWTVTEVFGRPLVTIQDPARSIALAPFFGIKTLRGANWQRPSGPANFTYHSNGKGYCAMVDGSIAAFSQSDLEEGNIVSSYSPLQ